MQLLVSVRSAAEARMALEGGCQIVDIKEPAHGALGMARHETIREIVAACREFSPSTPVSVALGDAGDWADLSRSASSTGLPEVAYVKLGTQGLSGTDWGDAWQLACQRAASPRAVGSKVILVAYADAAEVDAPSPKNALQVAAALRCDGILIDTAVKSGPGLFGCLSVEELLRMRESAAELGLSFGLAGRLCLVDIPQLRSIEPDIVGIRSAACGGNRNGMLSPMAVREFHQALIGEQPVGECLSGKNSAKW